jgi:hypothetical protein
MSRGEFLESGAFVQRDALQLLASVPRGLTVPRSMIAAMSSMKMAC